MARLISRKTVSGYAWELVAPSDMLGALRAMVRRGWSGSVAFDNGAWILRLSADGKQTVNAVLGRWLILDGELSVLEPEVFTENYTVGQVAELPDPEPEEAVDEVVSDVPVVESVAEEAAVESPTFAQP